LSALLAELLDPQAIRLARLAKDPARLLDWAGLPPDPWQAALLRSEDPRTLLLCCRQAGKSTAVAGLALKAALLKPGTLVLLLSRSERQSGELFRAKVMRIYDALGRPVAATRETTLELELANGSRIVSLPENEGTIRGYSDVGLLVIDEASRVPDDLYYSVRPMLAVSGGALVALTTPFGKRGWFHDEWQSARAWNRVPIRGDQCPRISAAFLAEERAALGERWFQQEYFLSFEDAVGAVFSQDDIRGSLKPGVGQLF
jgi:hypothetical protein